MTFFLTIVAVIGAYLLGSVPTAYLVTKWRRGVDVRHKGSGQVGGSNVWHSVSRRLGVAVAAADVMKGVVVILVSRWVGLGVGGQVLAGLAAICGHNWSVFLRFGGGRGIATLGGVILVLAPWETAVFGGFVVLGLVVRSVPLAILLGVIALPLSAWFWNEPGPMLLG
ncbi:MAG: glycerol-3-phosphate acyltransferase, partial [Dehalococcoidia bacterium]|nr:glycerol-3-phosphate acyltransferase [Dehalococcoidia bacterium]